MAATVGTKTPIGVSSSASPSFCRRDCSSSAMKLVLPTHCNCCCRSLNEAPSEYTPSDNISPSTPSSSYAKVVVVVVVVVLLSWNLRIVIGNCCCVDDLLTVLISRPTNYSDQRWGVPSETLSILEQAVTGLSPHRSPPPTGATMNTCRRLMRGCRRHKTPSIVASAAKGALWRLRP